jgi:hypothetical protein
LFLSGEIETLALESQTTEYIDKGLTMEANHGSNLGLAMPCKEWWGWSSLALLPS